MARTHNLEKYRNFSREFPKFQKVTGISEFLKNLWPTRISKFSKFPNPIFKARNRVLAKINFCNFQKIDDKYFLEFFPIFFSQIFRLIMVEGLIFQFCWKLFLKIVMSVNSGWLGFVLVLFWCWCWYYAIFVLCFYWYFCFVISLVLRCWCLSSWRGVVYSDCVWLRWLLHSLLCVGDVVKDGSWCRVVLSMCVFDGIGNGVCDFDDVILILSINKQ